MATESKASVPVRVAMFSTKPYDKVQFEKYQDCKGDVSTHFDFFDFPFNSNTATLASEHDVICCFVNDEVNAAALSHLKKAKLIAMRCAGFNNVDVKKASELGIKVVRVPTYSPHAVAEHAVALMLALNRKIHLAHNKVREGNFQLNGLLGFDLHKKVVGVIGTGAIGAVFAKIMKNGFECDVIAYDVIESQECIKNGIRYVSLDELLQSSDVISMHVPLLPSTSHMINGDTIKKMKQGVFLINTSRGGLIDTPAVVEGLKSGHIGGLAIDVYEKEASLFFEDHSTEVITDDTIARLFSFRNVLVTGHQAFFTQEALSEISKTTSENIAAFYLNQPLKNEVAPPKSAL